MVNHNKITVVWNDETKTPLSLTERKMYLRRDIHNVFCDGQFWLSA